MYCKGCLCLLESLAPRGVSVLEMIGTKEARQVLAELAKGALEVPLTKESRSSLERLKRAATRPVGD